MPPEWSADLTPLPFTALPAHVHVSPFNVTVDRVPYYVERWGTPEAVLSGQCTPTASEVAGAAGDAAAVPPPLFVELERAYVMHGAPRPVRLTAAGLEGRSAATAEVAERTLGRADRALVFGGSLFRTPVLTTVVQSTPAGDAIAVHVTGLPDALADVLTGAVQLDLECADFDVAVAGQSGWLRDGDARVCLDDTDGVPGGVHPSLCVLLHSHVRGADAFSVAVFERHPDPRANTSSFSSHGRASSPSAAVLLRVHHVVCCGRTGERGGLAAYFERPALQHAGESTALEPPPDLLPPQLNSPSHTPPTTAGRSSTSTSGARG